MSGDPNTIDYEALAQEAMRGVVRTILTRVAKQGLPGDHHFYISFDTLANGVSMSKRLKEKYPEEMTIVLQHRFWELAVNDDRFEVKLSFDGILERLVVPFAAIKVFFDPSVRYGLQFETQAATEAEPIADSDGSGAASDFTEEAPAGKSGTAVRPLAERKPRSPRKPKVEKAAAEPAEAGKQPKRVPERRPAEPQPVAPSAAPEPPAPTVPAVPQSGAQVVSLDAFRKK